MPTPLPRFPFNPLQPGGYSFIDAAALIQSEQGASTPTVAVLGDCKGGQPNVPLFFRDQATLKQVLRSGPAFDCARLALAAGAPETCVVRIGNSITPGTKALAGASSTPVTLTARDYGLWTNGVRVTVGANNLITITFTDTDTGITYTEQFAAGSGATAQNVVDLINGKVPGVAPSAFVTAAVTAGTMPLTTAAISNLTSGADTGTIVSGDWTLGLQKIETVDVSIVCAATGDSTVHAQVATHCDAMSLPQARAERTTVLGGVAGENVATVIARMTSLRKMRAQLIYPGVSLFDIKGELTSYAPFYAAALVAGAHAALPDTATALTHKLLDQVLDVETALSTIQGSDVDQLLAAGVTPITRAPGGGFWIVDSLSGYNADDSFRDFHKIRSLDFVARTLRERLEESYVGGKSLAGTPADIAHESDAYLREMLERRIIAGYQTTTVVKTNARTYAVTAPVAPVDTTKYIMLTLAVLPASAVNAGGQVSDNALI